MKVIERHLLDAGISPVAGLAWKRPCAIHRNSFAHVAAVINTLT
jgi:hypothetical protein